MRSVIGKFAQVGALWNVGSDRNQAGMIKVSQFRLKSHVDKLGSLMRYVYSDPLTVQLVRRHAGRCTSAEWVHDHIVGIAACLDNAVQKRQRFLSGIADTLFGLRIQLAKTFVFQERPDILTSTALIRVPSLRLGMAVFKLAVGSQ